MTTQLGGRGTRSDEFSDRCEPFEDWDTENFCPARPKNFSIPFSSVLAKAKQLSLFVDMDPDVLAGAPRIGGTRIPVYMVLNALKEYGNVSAVTRAYSSLTEPQVYDAIGFAVNVLECPIEHRPSPLD